MAASVKIQKRQTVSGGAYFTVVFGHMKLGWGPTQDEALSLARNSVETMSQQLAELEEKAKK